MSVPTILETDRLSLRRFTADDMDWLVTFYDDPDVVRYIGGPRKGAELEDLFRTRFLEYYDAHPGLGIWMTVEKSTGEGIGFHLLNHLRGQADIQVGYALKQTKWGRGFATEMALEVVRYGFVDLHLPRIVAITNIPNVASQRVLEKIGLRRGADRRLADPFYAVQGPMTWFERDAADWLTERAVSR